MLLQPACCCWASGLLENRLLVLLWVQLSAQRLWGVQQQGTSEAVVGAEAAVVCALEA